MTIVLEPAPVATAPATDPPVRRRTTVPALDGVRGVAVFLVVFFHLRPDLMRGGWIGMSVFFPLSGYLITGLLVQEVTRTGSVRLRSFWARRARRLLPALYALLAAVGIALVIEGLWTATEGGASLSSILYVNNWWQLGRAADYWSQFGTPSVYEHLWSLSVEEQFYVVWPLVVLAAARWSRRPVRTVGIAAVAIALSGAAYGLVMAHAGWGGMTEQYYSTFVRSAELLSGGALAVWHAQRRTTDRSIALDVAALALLAAIAGLALTLDATAESFVANGGMFVAGLATVVVIAAAVRDGLAARVLGLRPLRWMGTRCYSLYLWHWPIIVLVTPQNAGLTGWPLTALRTMMIVSASVLSYWLVEEPWRRGRRGLRRPAV